MLLLFDQLCALRRFHLLEPLCFVARLAQARRLRFDLTLCRREFARQCSDALAFLVDRLTMLRRELLLRGSGLLRAGGRVLILSFDRLCALRGFRLLELRCFVARLAQLRRLRFDLTLCRREFARQCSDALAFLVERLTMLRRARRQFLPRGRDFLREGGRPLPFLFDRLCALRGFRLPELRCFVARLAQLRRLRLDLALRRREFARQCSGALAFLVERLTMLRRAGRRLLPRGSAVLTLLSE
ncbi:hypothetical protein ACFIOY_09480 [Bradyrhizobium sp. TZ2]